MARSVPYLPKDVIERDADLLLAEYAQARGVTIAPPIPIEDIVEKFLKLRIEFDDTHKLFGIPRSSGNDVDILGALYFDEARIVIDESLDPEVRPLLEPRYRFTLGHEGGGHWRLHRPIFAKDPSQGALFDGSQARSVICRSSEATERVEWQANYYAACLLMPRALVMTAWQQRFGNCRPIVYEELRHTITVGSLPRSGLRPIGAALSNPDSSYEEFMNGWAEMFATLFLVSREAMRIRLEEMGLLCRQRPHQRLV